MNPETMEETSQTTESEETQDIESQNSEPQDVETQDETGETREPGTKAQDKKKYTEEEKHEYGKGVQLRINELTKRWRNEQRRADTLDARLREIEKKVITGERPQPPNIDAYMDELGQIDKERYQKDVLAWRDNDNKWQENYKKVEQPSQVVEEEQIEIDPETQAAFVQRGEELAKTYPDFFDVVCNKVFTPDMRRVLFGMDNGADVAYYLGKNPTEAMKIGNLNPVELGVALAKLQMRLSATPAKTPGAPSPITPLKGDSATAGKSLEDLSVADWIAKTREKMLT